MGRPIKGYATTRPGLAHRNIHRAMVIAEDEEIEEDEGRESGGGDDGNDGDGEEDDGDRDGE